jgi:hypothetical protein
MLLVGLAPAMTQMGHMAREAAGDDALDRALDRIEGSFDRFQEAHFWIHGLEAHYHQAAQFRWHLNVFLKVLKEVPQLLQMELQNEPGFTAWFRDQKRRLSSDPLIAFLSKQRDIVVHQRILLPDSQCAVGVTELRGMKLGMSLKVNPRVDSEHAMHRYLAVAAERGDFLGILILDEDSIPCVQRIWRLSGFDREIVEACASAWLRTGETVIEVIRWMGIEPPPFSLDCRHAEQRVQFKLYDREELRAQLRSIGGQVS